MLIPLMIVDVMQTSGFWYLNTYCNWSAPLFPWLTLLGAIGIGAIEMKSIYEPADAKESKELRQLSEFAQAIAAHKSDPEEIAKVIVAYLNDSKTSDK